MIGKLYRINREPVSTQFSCLRNRNIPHQIGDTILVLDVRVSDPCYGWKDVETLINGRIARFKTWAFKDLIEEGSLKLVN